MTTITTIVKDFLSSAKSAVSSTLEGFATKVLIGVVIAAVVSGSGYYAWHKFTDHYVQEGVTKTTAAFETSQTQLEQKLAVAQSLADADRAQLNQKLAAADLAKVKADGEAMKKAQTLQSSLNSYIAKNKDINTQLDKTKKTLTEVKSNAKTDEVIIHTLCFSPNDDGLRILNDSIPSSKGQ